MTPLTHKEQQRRRAIEHLQTYVQEATDLDLVTLIPEVLGQGVPVPELTQVQVHALLLRAQARHAQLARQRSDAQAARLATLTAEELHEEALAWLT